MSSLYDRPSYQEHLSDSFSTILGSSVEAEGRLTPEVSFDAAAQGGVLAFLGFPGRWGVFSGQVHLHPPGRQSSPSSIRQTTARSVS